MEGGSLFNAVYQPHHTFVTRLSISLLNKFSLQFYHVVSETVCEPEINGRTLR